MQNNEKEAISLLQALLSNKNKKQNDFFIPPSPEIFDSLRNAIISEGTRVSTRVSTYTYTPNHIIRYVGQVNNANG